MTDSKWAVNIAALLLAVALQFSIPSAAFGDEAVSILSQTEILTGSTELPTSGALSSGQPNTEVLDRIAKAGYVAVIDLRGTGEDRGIDEEREVIDRGLDYYALPVASREEISFENATKLDRLLASVNGPVLVHCGSGNRVGAVFALRASQSGASNEEALAVGRKAGLTSLEPVVVERLAERDGED